MDERYSYRNLIVWQRSQALALKVIHIVESLLRTWSNAVIARQIVASATSIGANIAEGHGRYSAGAHHNHLSIAKGSATETDSWLDSLRRGGWMTAEDEETLHRECGEIIAMLTSKMRQLERIATTSSKRLREEPAMYESSADQPPYPFVSDDYVAI